MELDNKKKTPQLVRASDEETSALKALEEVKRSGKKSEEGPLLHGGKLS